MMILIIILLKRLKIIDKLVRNIKLREMSHYKVAVFGAGFVGIPTASVLALRNPSVEVLFFSNDSLLYTTSTSTVLTNAQKASHQSTNQGWKRY